MSTLMTKDIQVLLDEPRGQGMVVSRYANTSVSEGFASHWLQPFKTEAGRIRQLLADDHQRRLEFERNVDAIRQALESPEARQGTAWRFSVPRIAGSSWHSPQSNRTRTGLSSTRTLTWFR